MAGLQAVTPGFGARLADRVQKCFRRFEIGRIKALGEPAVDRLKSFARIAGTTLIAQEAREAGSCTQLPRERSLTRSKFSRPDKAVSRRRLRICLAHKQNFSFDPQSFWHQP